MTAPLAANGLTLEALLASRPAGPVELHVADRIRTRSVGEAANDFVGDEIVHALTGGEPGGTSDRPRVATVSWVGPGGRLQAVDLPVASLDGAAHRAVMLAARRHGVPVRYWREDGEMVGSSLREVGALHTPRPPRDPGKLAPEARVLDVVDRFEAEVRRVDQPGLMGRKVLRRGPFEVVFRVVMDAHWIVVDYQHRSDAVRAELRRDQFLGIAAAARRPLAVTTEDAIALPTLEDWSRRDFRGRDFSAWAYERVLARSGL